MKRPGILAAERLERYRQIVPDWNAFVDAVSRPLPLCVWTNTLRTTGADVRRHLDRECVDVTPLDWRANAFKGPPSDRAGQSLPFVAGLYHIQEEVSLLPVTLMDPRPGERILDACSAPGNKTAQIAVAMENTGTLVANDRDAMRARATRGILDRLGVVNTTITRADAARLPDEAGPFDRVLADVPCTCEGTTRKHVDALLQSGRDASLRLHRIQLAILRRAVHLCRPGGLIVYATCTYAPEENEMVVDDLLREGTGDVEVLPAHVEGLTSSAGLTSWDGGTFDESLRRCLRIWPHQNDSGGFFVALLRKGGGPAESRDMPSDLHGRGLRTAEKAKWAELLGERFGLPDAALDPFILHRPNNKYVAAVAKDHVPLAAPDAVSVGMPLIRIGLRYPKLTTAGARLLGGEARRNVVHADASQAEAYMDRRDFYLSTRQLADLDESGYVLVEHQGAILGVGLFLRDRYVVVSMFPKVLSRAVSGGSDE